MTPSDSVGPKIGGGSCKQCTIIFYRGRVIANFVPKFVAVATGVNINDIVKLADPENHTLEPKITTLSYT